MYNHTAIKKIEKIMKEKANHKGNVFLFQPNENHYRVIMFSLCDDGVSVLTDKQKIFKFDIDGNLI